MSGTLNMNMMKKQWIITWAVVIVAGLVTWFLWPNNSTTYLRVIPSDATALVSVDIDEFIKESQLSADKLKKAFPKIAQAGTAGLDLSKPVYGFATTDGKSGLLAAVDDEKQLTNFLKENASLMKAAPIEEQQGYNWTFINNMFVLGYDDEVALLMGPTLVSNQAEVRQQMVTCLKQSKKESVLESPLYQVLRKQDGMLKAVTSLNVLPQYYEVFQNMGLPEHVDFSKILVTASMETEDDRIVLHSELNAEDHALAQQMKALDDMIRPISGEFVASVSKDALFWACANVKGEKFMEKVAEAPALRLYLMAINNVMDVEQMLRKVDGDLVFSTAVDEQMTWQIQGQVSDMSFMKEADYWMAEARKSRMYQFNKLDDDLYCMSSRQFGNVFLGTKDRNLLFCNDRKLMDNLQNGAHNDLLQPYKKDIQNSKFYVWTNVTAYAKALRMFGMSKMYENMLGELSFMDKIDAMALRSVKATSMDLIFYLKDKNSGLKQMFE